MGIESTGTVIVQNPQLIATPWYQTIFKILVDPAFLTGRHIVVFLRALRPGILPRVAPARDDCAGIHRIKRFAENKKGVRKKGVRALFREGQI